MFCSGKRTNAISSWRNDRYQTTVPETVRRAIKLGKRDKIDYSIRPDGEQVVTWFAHVETDGPLLGKFPGVLAQDIAKHADRLQLIDTNPIQRIQQLVGNFNCYLDAPLLADDE